MSTLAVTDDISTGAAVEVAIVLDSATNRRIVRNALQLIGYKNICSFGAGNDFLDHVSQQNDIDLLITGKSLPDLRGGHLAQEIRQSPQTDRLPILMVGYQFTEEDVLHAVDRGIDAFLLMPFSPEALQDKLSAISRSG